MSGNPYEPTPPVGEPPRDKKIAVFSLASLLMAICIVGLAIALLLPAIRTAGPASRRTQCTNNLKQIAMALHYYESEYGSLPPAYTMDSEGRPMHSWRTLILPYLEHKALYDSIDLSKPWNAPENAEAHKSSPAVYRCPSSDARPNSTTYMVVNAPESCFHDADARQLSKIADGMSNTLFVIEVPPEEAVHWMAPQDASIQGVLGFDSDTPFAHNGGTNAAFADMSVTFLSADMSVAARRAIITMAGNDSRLDESDEGAAR